MTKIKALEPDILVSLYNSMLSGVATVKQFHEIGLKSFHLGSFYGNRPEFIPQAGKASEYLVWGYNQFPKSTPKQKEFAEKIMRRWNVVANTEIAAGYDGVYNALDAIERAGSLEPKEIIDSLAKLDRRGVTGRFMFDQSNHEIKDGPDFIPLPVCQIVGEKNLIIWPPLMKNAEYTPQPWIK
jgi:branched-chain amino acid transport system substrate-binding protein